MTDSKGQSLLTGSERDDEIHPSPLPNYNDISLTQEILFIVLICSAQILTQASLAPTINSFQYVGDTLGATTPGEISWFSSSFSLTAGSFILISGRLGDMFGYKLLFILGFTWFGLWSLICGISNYARSLIFFSFSRAMQGIGPAIVMPNAVALIGAYYPTGLRKNIIMCCFGAVAPSGFVLGSLFTGLFAQLVSWPWFFYMMCMVCAIIAFIGFLVIPVNIGSSTDKRQAFDCFGAVSGVCALVLVNFAFNQGPVVGWHVPYVYSLLIVGVITFALFCFIEMRVQNPLVPKSLAKGETAFILGCIGAGWSCFGIWIYYSHQFGILIQHHTVIEMAIRFIPCLVSGLTASSLTAFLLQKFQTSIIMMLAMISFCAGICIQGTKPVNQTYWIQMFISTIITPFGMDMSFPASVIILSNFIPKHQQGVAASLVSTVLNYSISIGLGIAGTVEHYVIKNGGTTLEGISAAFYTGMGLSGLGCLVGAAFMLDQLVFDKRRKTLLESDVERNMADTPISQTAQDAQT